MARGTTLVKLLDDLRAETGASLNPAHNAGVRDAQVKKLQQVQEALWEDTDWGHLRVRRAFNAVANQRYYAVPDDLLIDRVEQIEVRFGSRWQPIVRGISEDDYRLYDSDLALTGWPPLKWQIFEGEQIEIWPLPALSFDSVTLDGQFRVTGIRRLRPLVKDGDVADLDDRLIVLFAAADALAGKPQGAQKQQAATRLYMKLRGNMTTKRRFRMFGGGEPQRILRGPPPVQFRSTT